MSDHAPGHTADNAADEKELLTPEEACALLGLSRAVLGRRMAAAGLAPQLRAIGPQRNYRFVFRRADVEKMAATDMADTEKGTGAEFRGR